MTSDLLFGMGIVALASMVVSVGAFMFKLASNNLEKGIVNLLKKPFFYSGLLLYGAASLVFVYALRFGDLSALYPLSGLNYIWVSLLSIKFLGEKINRYKWFGIFLIMLGVAFIGLGA